MEKTFTYTYQENQYQVVVTYKKMRSITYRFRNGAFYVSAPVLTLQKQIEKGLDRFAGKLIAKDGNKPVDDTFFYLFGEKLNIGTSGQLKLSNGRTIAYSSKEDLYQKLKPLFLGVVEFRVREYQKKMGLPAYAVKAREMDTRFGSNSRQTKTLHFSYTLMHFAIPIIDSVVVHELAHIKFFDHSDAFYDYLMQYCPTYKICRKKLINKVYTW